MNWEMAFESMKDTPTNRKVKKAIMAVYGSYRSENMPKGVCDPMYIMNTIALNLGIGDGKGNFNIPEGR